MKKLFCILLMLGIFVLGCSSSKITDKTTETQENKKLYLIPLADNEPYWAPIIRAAKAKAIELGYDLEVRAGVSGDPSRPQRLLEATQEAIDQNAAGIVLAAIDPDMFDRKAKEALDAGIKIITFDTDITTPENRLTYVGTDNYQAGFVLGEKAAEDLINKGVTSGKIATMVYNGSAQNMLDRLEGCEDGFAKGMGKKNSSFEWLSLIINDNNAAEGKRQLESQLIANPELNVIFTFGTESVITGTMGAMRSQNVSGDAVFHYGFDYSPTFEIGIDDGYITAIVDQNTKAIGEGVIEALDILLNGGEVEAVYPIDVNWVVSENIMEYGSQK